MKDRIGGRKLCVLRCGRARAEGGDETFTRPHGEGVLAVGQATGWPTSPSASDFMQESIDRGRSNRFTAIPPEPLLSDVTVKALTENNSSIAKATRYHSNRSE